MVDDVLGVKPRVFQTVYLERQKPNTSLSVFMPLINSRAFLVTVVAPSKRPVTLHYWKRVKRRRERTLRGENFRDLGGILVFNGVTGDIDRSSTRIDNDHIPSGLQGITNRSSARKLD